MKNTHNSWSTEAEIKFLQGLGGWCPNTETSRAELLRRYLDMMGERDWDGMDYREVRGFALTLLNNERLVGNAK